MQSSWFEKAAVLSGPSTSTLARSVHGVSLCLSPRVSRKQRIAASRVMKVTSCASWVAPHLVLLFELYRWCNCNCTVHVMQWNESTKMLVTLSHSHCQTQCQLSQVTVKSHHTAMLFTFYCSLQLGLNGSATARIVCHESRSAEGSSLGSLTLRGLCGRTAVLHYFWMTSNRQQDRTGTGRQGLDKTVGCWSAGGETALLRRALQVEPVVGSNPGALRGDQKFPPRRSGVYYLGAQHYCTTFGSHQTGNRTGQGLDKTVCCWSAGGETSETALLRRALQVEPVVGSNPGALRGDQKLTPWRSRVYYVGAGGTALMHYFWMISNRQQDRTGPGQNCGLLECWRWNRTTSKSPASWTCCGFETRKHLIPPSQGLAGWYLVPPGLVPPKAGQAGRVPISKWLWGRPASWTWGLKLKSRRDEARFDGSIPPRPSGVCWRCLTSSSNPMADRGPPHMPSPDASWIQSGRDFLMELVKSHCGHWLKDNDCWSLHTFRMQVSTVLVHANCRWLQQVCVNMQRFCFEYMSLVEEMTSGASV